MSWRRKAAVGVALAVLAGCSASVDSSGSPAPTLPPRPREVRIDGQDPCVLLTELQLTELDIGEPSFTPSDGDNGATCRWQRSPDEPVESYGVQILIGLAAETALRVIPEAAATSVAGFPAVQSPPQYGPPDIGCVIVIDVAPEQNLYVRYSYNGTTVSMTRELACQKARTAAEMVMQTLLSTR